MYIKNKHKVICEQRLYINLCTQIKTIATYWATNLCPLAWACLCMYGDYGACVRAWIWGVCRVCVCLVCVVCMCVVCVCVCGVCVVCVWSVCVWYYGVCVWCVCGVCVCGVCVWCVWCGCVVWKCGVEVWCVWVCVKGTKNKLKFTKIAFDGSVE